MSPAKTARYGSASIALHWLTLVLIIGVYACIELREFWPKGDPTRDALKSWHFTLGLTVLSLTAVRILVRLASPTPPITPPPARWQTAGAHLVHFALYAMMIGMPIGGWLILSGEAKTIPFWGFSLPPLIGENKGLAELIEEVHKTVGKAGYFLIGLHAAAAIFHHAILKDDTLKRMMPGR